MATLQFTDVYLAPNVVIDTMQSRGGMGGARKMRTRMTGAESNSREGRKEALKIMAWGLGWIVAAVWLLLYWAGNPMHDLRLMLYAETAPGQVIDTWEEPEDGIEGKADWSHGAVYTFSLPDGREMRGGTKGSGRLKSEFRDLARPVAVEVEYDPADPSINRIKGGGSQSLVEWLLRKVLLGVVLLAALTSPGVILIRDGVKKFRAASIKVANR